MKQFIKCPECGKVQLYDSKKWMDRQHLCINRKCDHWLFNHEIPDPLPALSIKQPWAWLIVNGYKDIENRNGLKNFTGDFLIHTGRKFDKKGFKWILQNRERLGLKLGELPLLIDESCIKYRVGGIIGHATITGFVEKSDSPWFVGKYGLLIKDAKPLPFTPCKGKLSFFKPEIN